MGKDRDLRSRKLVLVDFENVLFGQHESTDLSVLSQRSKEVHALVCARRSQDQFLVGCNPELVFAARSVFPRAKIVVGKGVDGADQALLNAFDLDVAFRRFSEVCIVSGDHAFADLAYKVRQAGLDLSVLAPKFGLSTDLRLQATSTTLLSTPTSSPLPKVA